MEKVLLFLAEGFEEVEAVTPVDFLRRAGIDVTIAGIGGLEITGAHGIKITADVELKQIEDGVISPDDYDGIILPGGMPGAENIASEKKVINLIESFNNEGKVIAAICASPGVILPKTGVLDGRKATAYPGFEAQFGKDVKAQKARLVTDGNIVTSMGPGTAAEFAIELVRIFADNEKAEEIRKATLQMF